MRLPCAVVFVACLTAFSTCAEPAAPHTVAHGALWPLPASTVVTGTSALSLTPDTFTFKAVGHSSGVLDAAFTRYKALLFPPGVAAAAARGGVPTDGPVLAALAVDVRSANETLVLGVNETYALLLSAGSTTATLVAETVYGALRGLETFTQLSEVSATARAVPSAFAIHDEPRFQYRGLMIDVARHFMTAAFVEHILDACSYSKLSVLHVHITDDQSWPIDSSSYPQLAAKGAFFPSQVWSKADVSAIVAAGTARGIIVIPEFDMPAHSSSWGAGLPGIMAQCAPLFQHGSVLNPTLNDTYSVIAALLREFTAPDAFGPSPLLHLGGDEVPLTCWSTIANVTSWMQQHGLSSFNDLEGYFLDRVWVDAAAPTGKTPMYWEEVFDANITLPSHAIIEGWKSAACVAVAANGRRCVNSFKWYLNHGCDTYGDGTWLDFYSVAPDDGVAPADQHNILGGESTMWNVCVDATSFDTITWPRAAAAAEKLWSPASATTSAANATERMAMHHCRLRARGVAAGALDTSTARMAQC